MKKKRKIELRPLRIAHQYYEYQLSFESRLFKPSYQDPSPALSIVDKSCKDWCEEITANEEKAIDRHVSTPFVGKILEDTELDYAAESGNTERHAISVTDISHNDSTGAPKNPCSSLLAIH